MPFGRSGRRFFLSIFTTVSSVRSDDIRFFRSGLLDCGSFSTCVLTRRYSGWCAALAAVYSKLNSRHVSPIQTTFCDTLFTRTEYPHATWLAWTSLGSISITTIRRNITDFLSAMSDTTCPSLNRKLTSGCEKKSCHIAMRRAIGLAQINHTTTLIIAVRRFPLNKTTGSDPITPTLTSTTSSLTVQLCPLNVEGYSL